MLHRRLIIVDTPFAMRMARVDAARTSDNGIEILTLPLLAARLAGGFRRPVGGAQLAEAVAGVLKAEPLVDLDAVRDLPGMPKALIDSLSDIWRENLTLSDLVVRSNRAADLERLDRSVRARLPSGLFGPPDLAAVALANVELVAKLFETVTLMRMLDIEPVWRPLINAISGVVATTWHTIGKAERGWFRGNQMPESSGRGAIASAEICADPRAEVVEALRWARRLLSTGTMASEIAVVAASPAAWDEHMQVLATSNLQVHFSHGRPALGTAVGQCCAALADVLINGLSQDRIRRLQRLSPYLRKHLPRGWMVGIGAGAGLFTAAHWRRALASAPTDMSAVMPVLVPALDVLEKGLDAAAEAGELLLSGKSPLTLDGQKADRQWAGSVRMRCAAGAPAQVAAHRIHERLYRYRAHRKLLGPKRSDERRACERRGRIIDGALEVQEDVDARSLPFLDELRTVPMPGEDVELGRADSLPSFDLVEAVRKTVSAKCLVVVHVEQPEHAVVTCVKCLSCHALLVGNGRVLQFEDSGSLRPLHQDIGAVAL